MMNVFFKLLASVLLSASVSFAGTAKDPLESQLKSFHANPKNFYMRHIPKYDLQGRRVKSNVLGTRKQSAVTRKKLQYRSKYFNFEKKARTFTAPPGENDKANVIVDGGNPIDNIFEIESRGLKMASLPESPWSGDYWAIYKGILGNRFLDRSHSYLSDWKEYFDYVNENQFFSIFQTGNKEAINQLSVSEKYDLLIGDQSGSFTFAMWDQGRDYYDRDGTVETWMGICHGWAAATVMVARPTKSVQALAFDGKTILNFNPSELKGLLSYLWANGDFETRFVGGRCNLKDVKRDEVGRPLAKECFDTNPATWYITAVNQIGIARRGFVMDVTPDYEVWNQPVYSYSVKYFNPQSLKASETLVGAIVNRADYSKDKFKKYRAANSTQIVGIEMSIQYTVEETANSSETDEPANDNLRTVKYLFDLELDAGGKIIGGEWYESNHPDFMWVPEKQAVASVTEDSYLDPAQWNGYDVLPPLWQKVGKSAAKNRNVLGSVTNKLIQRAQ